MIKIVCVGRIKEQYFLDAIAEYQKRVKRYHNIDIIEVPDYSCGDIKVDLLKEKELIMKVLNPKDYLIALDLNGKQMNSIDFYKKIDSIHNINPNITFIIGGSNGIHEDIKKMVKEKVSFSTLTFPHQLFRIILLEQIYRAFKIKNNEPYHK